MYSGLDSHFIFGNLYNIKFDPDDEDIDLRLPVSGKEEFRFVTVEVIITKPPKVDTPPLHRNHNSFSGIGGSQSLDYKIYRSVVFSLLSRLSQLIPL